MTNKSWILLVEKQHLYNIIKYPKVIKTKAKTISYTPNIFYQILNYFYSEVKLLRTVDYFDTLFLELLSYFTKSKIKCN